MNKKKHKNKVQLKKILRPQPSPVGNAPSTSGYCAQAEEPRVPPLPVLPPPSYSDFEFMSNRKRKYLTSIQKQHNQKDHPGHMKIRLPPITPLTAPRVPPTEDVPDVTVRLEAASLAEKLFHINTFKSSTSNYKASVDATARLLRDQTAPVITPGNLRRQNKLAERAAGFASSPESADSGKSDLDSDVGDYELPSGSSLPSFVFTPITEKSQSDYGSCEQSPETFESTNDDGEVASRPNNDVETSVRSKKRVGKLDDQKKIVKASEMDILARAIKNIRLEDDEMVFTTPQASPHVSENIDSAPEEPTVHGDDQTQTSISESSSVALAEPQSTFEEAPEEPNMQEDDQTLIAISESSFVVSAEPQSTHEEVPEELTVQGDDLTPTSISKSSSVVLAEPQSTHEETSEEPIEQGDDQTLTGISESSSVVSVEPQSTQKEAPEELIVQGDDQTLTGMSELSSTVSAELHSTCEEAPEEPTVHGNDQTLTSISKSSSAKLTEPHLTCEEAPKEPTVHGNDQTVTSISKSSSAVLAEPHSTLEDQIVSKREDSLEAQEDEELQNAYASFLEMTENYILKVEIMKDESIAENAEIVADSVLGISIAPMFDTACDSCTQIKTALDNYRQDAVGDAGAEGVGVIQSSKTVKLESVASEQLETPADPKTDSSQIATGAIPVEDGHLALSGQGATIEDGSGDIPVEGGAPASSDKQTADPQPVSRRKKRHGKKKRVDDLQTESKNCAVGTAPVEGSEKKGVGDCIVAESEEIVLNETEDTIWDGEMLPNMEDAYSQFQFITEDDPKDNKNEAEKNAPPTPTSSINPPPHHCPARLYCLEACSLRTHLSTCWQPFCKVKYCWQTTQVIAHWIHCVEKNCSVCPSLGEIDAEKVRSREDLLSKLTDQKDVRRYQMEQKATDSELSEFLTSQGQHVLLAYFIEYYFEVYMAYHKLREESSLRSFKFVDEQLSENIVEAVRHSCNCLPLNNCRENQCYRLRMVIAHWSKWSGLCFSTECNLCDRIYARIQKNRGEISELVKFINSESEPGKADTLRLQLDGMVQKGPEKEKLGTSINWSDANRRNFKNACVNTCIFADTGYGELQGNADETLDLASVFNKNPTFQLLVLSRYILHKAISVKEEWMYERSENVTMYYPHAMKEGVKLIRSVHTFVKKEIPMFDDSWDSGSEVMSSGNISQDRRYLMLMSSRMGNQLINFAAAMYDDKD